MADPFWDDSAMMLISSLIAYVKETIPEESGMHNFHMILEILRAAGRDDSDSRNSILANMMENLHKKNPTSWAYKQFQNVNQAPDKTFHTIVVTAISKFCSLTRRN